MGDGHMVGRDRELQRGLDAAGRDGCVGVVIVGPAGVGKSALATAIATRSRAPGGEVLRITATESASSISLGAVAPLLSAPSAPTTQADMIRHTVTALVERAGTGRLVVVVDDAHQLDDASATLVHQLALTGAAFVVATLRSQEPVPDPVTALWKDGRAERMDLTELGLAESTVLAQSILGHPLHPTAASTLFNASAGNPLFLQQLVASARDVGVLELVAGRGPVAGGWRLTGPLPLPSDLISAVESRLQHLSDEDRSVLELLALGDPLGAAVLEDLAGPDAQARLERLEADGFILAELVRRRLDVRLAHPMYGEVLRAGMPHSWASRARMMLADAVTALGARRRDDALRIAVWRLEARAPIPSAIAHAAAELALLRFDPQLAAQIVRQSDGGRADGAAATDAMAPDDVFLLALIAARSAQPDDALEQLDRLDELLDSIEHDGHLRAKAMVLRFDVLTYIKGHFEAAFALELPDDSDRSDGAGLAARKAVVLITLGRPTFAAAVLAPLEGAPLSRHADVWVSLARAMTAASLGQVEEAMTTIARCEAGFAAIGWDPGLPDPAIVSFVRLRILQQEGRLDEACALAVRGIDFERDRWSEQGVAWNRMASSSIHRVRGHPLLAADEARASAAVFERVGSYQLAGVALAELAAAAATAGDRDGAAAAAQQCDDLGVANFYGRCAHAWAIVGAGRITDGVARLVEVLVSRRGREAREELLLVLDIVGLGGAKDVVDVARDLAESGDGALAAVAHRYAAAAASDDAHALGTCAEELAALGCALAAAQAAAASCAAHLRNGDARRSRAAERRAAELSALLDGVRTPGLHPPFVQATLSPREREVAALAARGETSAAIGDLLGLTQRTVESYVQDAYDKLDVASRAELAAVLSPSASP